MVKGRRNLDLLVWVVLGWAILGLFYTRHDPSAQQFRESAFAEPSWNHWFGIDGLGRDFGSRLWRGVGNTVAMGLAALFLNFAFAGLLLVPEQGGPRWMGRLIGLAIGVWVAVPVIFIGLVLLVFLRPSPGALVLAAALGNVPLAFRQLRIMWVEQRRAPYVEASEVLGAGRWFLFRYTIWPNLKADLIALSKLIFAISLLELSGLAFLGLLGDPDFPELGSLLRQNQAYLFKDPALVVWPGVLLSGILLIVHLSRTNPDISHTS